jgi:hypothetical protein
VLEGEKGDVHEPPVSISTGVPKPVTITDDDNDDDDPTNRYSTPFIHQSDLDIPVHPYISQQRPPMRFDDPVPRFSRSSVPHDSILRDFRELITESISARRTPVPTTESRTKPPMMFKGEEKSFVKVDVFLKRLKR